MNLRDRKSKKKRSVNVKDYDSAREKLGMDLYYLSIPGFLFPIGHVCRFFF